MIRTHPPLPEFPPVPTAPMDPATKRRLMLAIQECQKLLKWPEGRAHVLIGYALIWIHLTLERNLDPRRMVNSTSKGYQDVVAAFLDAGFRIGVHDRGSLGWHIPEVSANAAALWRQAKEAQAGSLPQLPGLGLGLTPLAEVKPSWLKSMKSGVAR